MKNTLIGLFALILLPHLSTAMNHEDIVTVQLDRPLWALSLDDPSWIFPDTKPKKKVLVFCFSAAQKGAPKEGQTQQEDDLGRTTRSLPLYISERINLETDTHAINLIPILKGTGPIVAGQRNDPKEIVSALSKKPDFIISGHFEQDYIGLRKKIVIYLYETKTQKEIILVEISSFFKSHSDVGVQAASEIMQALARTKAFNFHSSPSNFPRPSQKYLREYLDGLGQLFIQTVVQNGYAPAASLWGEDRMLAWYHSLWEAIPDSYAPRIMYLRGILASHSYGTEAFKPHAQTFGDYLMSIEDRDDILNRLSPLYFKELEETERLKAKIDQLRNIDDPRYVDWLTRICE